jgi:hypothetical protein
MDGPEDYPKPELSTLLESGTFYFALTVLHRPTANAAPLSGRMLAVELPDTSASS